jgi:hypothetical protein
MNAVFSDNLLQGTDEIFLRTAYVTLLGRQADPSGMQDYLARLASGVSRKQVWLEIADSPEARSFATTRAHTSRSANAGGGRVSTVRDLLALDGPSFISEAYRQVLGREPDADGMRHYGTRLSSGVSKEQILADLRSDPEGQAFPSAVAGLDDLVRSVQSGSGAHRSTSAPASLEDLFALDGRQFVEASYEMLFRRAADPTGLARYCPLLLQGYSKLFVLDALYTSPEAREKGVDIPELEQRLRAYRKAQRPGWGGWHWRHVRGIESDLPRDREIRAVLARLSGQ